MNPLWSPQARATQLSLLIHLLLVLAGLLYSRYAINPEKPPLVIDFSLAAVNTGHVETGPSPGGETPNSRANPVPASATLPEVTRKSPPKKPVSTPKKVIRPAKPPRKPQPTQPKPERREEAIAPVPVAPTPAQSSSSELATAAQTAADEASGSGRQTDISGTPSAGSPSRGAQGAAGEGGGIPYSYEYVRRLIINNLRFPSIARKMRLSGKIVVAFTLQYDGQVADIAITTSSGHAILDDEVAATLRRIAPLPRPPAPARLVVPIVFNLRQ